jgi:serine/threonine protein kinase
MWSLGIVLYEMMSLKLPFDATSMENLLKNIIRGVPPPTPRTFSKELRAVSSLSLHQFGG